MKRVLCFVVALLLMVTSFSTVGFAEVQNEKFSSVKELLGVWMSPSSLTYVEIGVKGITFYNRTADSLKFAKEKTLPLKSLRLSADKKTFKMYSYRFTDWETLTSFTKDGTGAIWMMRDRGDGGSEKMLKFKSAKQAIAYAKSGEAVKKLWARTPNGIYLDVYLEGISEAVIGSTEAEYELYDSTETLVGTVKASKENWVDGVHQLLKFDVPAKEGAYYIQLKSVSNNVKWTRLNYEYELNVNQYGPVKVEVVYEPFGVKGSEALPFNATLGQ